MTDRLEWLDREVLVGWLVALVILDGMMLVVGSSLKTAVVAMLFATLGSVLSAWWDHRNSEETAGGDRNRQQTPTKHN